MDDLISREEVIKAVDRHTVDRDGIAELDEDITVILEEIQTHGNAHQMHECVKPTQPTHDLISRQAAIKMINELTSPYTPKYKLCGEGYYKAIDHVRNGLRLLPSADRPTGKWASEDGTPSEASYSVYCSRCGQWSEYRGFFCLWCGADMRGEQKMTINVMDHIENTTENQTISATAERSFEVGETVLIPYKITEINAKQTGSTVLKQIRLDGPAINPSQETYTEHRLREVFDVV